MLFWIYVAMSGAVYFGMPVMPVLIVGALIQAATAYVFTKNAACINLAICLLMVSIPGYVLFPMLAQNAAELMPLAQMVEVMTPWVTAISSVVTLFMCTAIGVLGIPGRADKRQ